MENSIGKILKDARESKRLTIEDIASATNINKRYIESIENENFSDLPGSTYVYGFLRIYAETLQLDSKDIIKKYKNLSSKEIDDVYIPDDIASDKMKNEEPPKSNNLFYIISFGVLVLVLGFIIYVVLSPDSFASFIRSIFTK